MAVDMWTTGLARMAKAVRFRCSLFITVIAVALSVATLVDAQPAQPERVLLHAPRQEPGQLRLLTSGPMLTVAGGYPAVTMEEEGIASVARTSEQTRQFVRTTIEQGAVIIKVALEPGGESLSGRGSRSCGQTPI